MCFGKKSGTGGRAGGGSMQGGLGRYFGQNTSGMGTFNMANPNGVMAAQNGGLTPKVGSMNGVAGNTPSMESLFTRG